MKLLLLHGPNLNMLGSREPHLYGSTTLDDLLGGLRAEFPHLQLDHFQTNNEGELLERIHRTLQENYQGLIINAGAWTHYSYALADALAMVKVPKLEIHISHIFAREAFRHQSVLAPVCHGLISGLGIEGYRLAVQWMERNAAR